MHKRYTRIAAAATPLALLLISGSALPAAEVEVSSDTHHDVSAPLRTIPDAPQTVGGNYVIPMRTIPGTQADANSVAVTDPGIQDFAGPFVAATPGLNVAGLGTGFTGPNGSFTDQYAPPDTNAAVGTTQVVQVVNLSYAVFDKTTGNPTLGPKTLSTLFSGFGGGCSGGSLSDPVVLFDKIASRWVFEFFTTSTPYTSCFAVSTTADATGTYNRYSFVFTNGLPDYTKIATWPDAYYLSSRIFKNGATYTGPEACAVDRAKMLTGAPATMQCFQIASSTLDGLMPADLDGKTLPPAGSPDYYVIQGNTGANALLLYKFHVDFTVPANSAFTGPTTLAVNPYTQAQSSSAVPQPGTSTQLDALGNFLMHRVTYRNFGAYESVLINHSINVTQSPARIGVRWYELRGLGTTPVVYQQGTYSPDSTYRWMGSIAQDKRANIALGYSVSSTTVEPGIRFTGRTTANPLGKLQAEAVIFNGIGSQTSGLTRWGDYSSMSVDPVDDCTMWYTTEYLPANGEFNWSTRLFSLKFLPANRLISTDRKGPLSSEAALFTGNFSAFPALSTPPPLHITLHPHLPKS